MELSEQTILKLLIDKGVELSHIQPLKNRKVICFNNEIYDTSIQGNRLYSQETIDIPVSKIISTDRIIVISKLPTSVSSVSTSVFVKFSNCFFSTNHSQ